jgi:hypothetical protein
VSLERLGEDLAVHSGEMIAAHRVDEPVAEAFAYESSGVAPESLVIACGMEYVVHASTDEPYSGF